MIWIYRLHLRQTVAAASYYAAGCAVAFLLILKLIPYDHASVYLACLPALAFATQIAALSTFGRLPANLGWLLASPLSKRAVFVLHCLNNATTVLVFNAAALLVASLVYFAARVAANGIALAALLEFIKLLPALPRAAAADPSWFPAVAVSWPLTILLMVGPYRRMTPTQRIDGDALGSASKRVAAIVAGSAALVALLVAMIQFNLPLVADAFLLALGLSAIVPAAWRVMLSLSPRQSRLAFGLSFAVGLAPLLLLALRAERLRYSGSPQARAAAIEFLGGFAPGVDRDEIALLLVSRLDSVSFQRMGEFYANRFNGGRPFSGEADPNIRFRALVSANDAASARVAMRLFDLSTLARADLEAYDAAAGGRDDDLDSPLRWLAAKLTADDVLSLLRSRNEGDNAYALLRLRYDRDPRGVRVILEEMPRYTEWNVSLSLTTLSILAGRKLTLEALQKARLKGGWKSLYRAIDCGEFRLWSGSKLLHAEPAVVNACVRARVDRARIPELRRLEQTGWLDPASHPEQFKLSAGAPSMR